MGEQSASEGAAPRRLSHPPGMVETMEDHLDESLLAILPDLPGCRLQPAPYGFVYEGADDLRITTWLDDCEDGLWLHIVVAREEGEPQREDIDEAVQIVPAALRQGALHRRDVLGVRHLSVCIAHARRAA